MCVCTYMDKMTPKEGKSQNKEKKCNLPGRPFPFLCHTDYILLLKEFSA